MAAPAFVSATAQSSATATTIATVTLPATAANDILVARAVNGGANVALTLSGTYSGGAFASIDSGGWTTGWGGVWWSRCTTNHSGQTVICQTATDSISLQVVRYSGCITTGNPYDTNIAAATVAAGANATLAAFSTTVADTLVVLSYEIDDNQPVTAPLKNAVAMTLRAEATSTGGADSLAGSSDLAQATVGTTGTFSITVAAGTNTGKRMTGFALKPPTPPPTVFQPPSRRPGPRWAPTQRAGFS